MMTSEELFNKHVEMLEAKDPQLFFLLCFESHDYELIKTQEEVVNAKCLIKDMYQTLYDESDHGSYELKNFKKKFKKKDVETVYLIGLGLGKHVHVMQEWLDEKPTRSIVIFEDNIQVILAFLHEAQAGLLITHSQIDIRYVLGHKLYQAIEETIKFKPCEKIYIDTLAAYKKAYPKKIHKAKYLAYRAASIHANLLKDDLYQHLLFRNYHKNYLELSRAFSADDLRGAFKGVPCVICGAGPSLNKAASLLKKFEDKALIFAGGSTITALSHQGIIPHMGFAIDPNKEEYERFKPSKALTMPLIVGTRVYPEIFQMLSGPVGYLRTQTGGLVEVLLDEKLGLKGELFQQGMIQDGMSVTMICLAAAVAMQCNPIIFVGIDLAYVQGKHYADGVVKDLGISKKMLSSQKACDKLIKRKNREGQYVLTCMRWVMERVAIDHFIKKHPEVTFIDAGDGGLGFKEAKRASLKGLVSEKKFYSQDLRALVYQKISTCQLLSEEVLIEFMQELKKSFERCKELITQLYEKSQQHLVKPHYQDDPHVILALMDLEEEMAYQNMLRIQLEAFDAKHGDLDAEIEGIQKRWKFSLEVLEIYQLALRAS